jgi:hydrogenase maturation protease
VTELARSPSDTARVLVAGVGNVFLADDGFGVEVARRLAARKLPPGVEVADVGIRGMHLAYRLLDGYRALVLVDTVRRGDPPGTLSLIEHDLDGVPAPDAAAFDAHGMDPGALFGMLDGLARGIGVERPVGRVLVVGCEPASVEEGIGLTNDVAAVVDRATQAVVDLVGDLLEEAGSTEGGRGEQDPAGHRAGRHRSGGGGGGQERAGRQPVPQNSGDVGATHVPGHSR